MGLRGWEERPNHVLHVKTIKGFVLTTLPFLPTMSMMRRKSLNERENEREFSHTSLANKNASVKVMNPDLRRGAPIRTLQNQRPTARGSV